MPAYVLNGVPVYEYDWFEPGKVVITGHPLPRTIGAHPLDVIAMRLDKKPLTRLKAAMGYVEGQAQRKLDREISKLTDPTPFWGDPQAWEDRRMLEPKTQDSGTD